MLPNPRRFDIAREVPHGTKRITIHKKESIIFVIFAIPGGCLTAQKILLPAHQMQEEDFGKSRIHTSGASGTSD